MFTLLRCVIIVGLIFYFSPEREAGLPWSGEEERRAADTPQDVAKDEVQEGTWERLVGSVKEDALRTAAQGKALSAGLRLKDDATRLLADAQPRASERSRSSDQAWALRATQDPPRRCVYRCDGAE